MKLAARRATLSTAITGGLVALGLGLMAPGAPAQTGTPIPSGDERAQGFEGAAPLCATGEDTLSSNAGDWTLTLPGASGQVADISNVADDVEIDRIYVVGNNTTYNVYGADARDDLHTPPIFGTRYAPILRVYGCGVRVQPTTTDEPTTTTDEPTSTTTTTDDEPTTTTDDSPTSTSDDTSVTETTTEDPTATGTTTVTATTTTAPGGGDDDDLPTTGFGGSGLLLGGGALLLLGTGLFVAARRTRHQA